MSEYDFIAKAGLAWLAFAILGLYLLILAIFTPYFIYRIKINSDEINKSLKKLLELEDNYLSQGAKKKTWLDKKI